MLKTNEEVCIRTNFPWKIIHCVETLIFYQTMNFYKICMIHLA